MAEMDKKLKLSIIIVNYNARNYLKDCISSIKKNVNSDIFEIILVDNDSSDGSVEYIQEQFPEIDIISHKKNLGYAVGNNRGIKKSKGRYILFLNPDTIVFDEAIHFLLKELENNRNAGAVGPALFKGKNKYQISFGKKVNFIFEVFQKCFFNLYYKLKLKHFSLKKEVGWLSGACLMVRKSILDDIGYFDEQFFLYFEDIDLCYRIREEGWKIYYFPRAKVFHEGGASTSLLNFSFRYEYRKSQIYFYKKHNSKLSFILLQCYLFLFSLLQKLLKF